MFDMYICDNDIVRNAIAIVNNFERSTFFRRSFQGRTKQEYIESNIFYYITRDISQIVLRKLKSATWIAIFQISTRARSIKIHFLYVILQCSRNYNLSPQYYELITFSIYSQTALRVLTNQKLILRLVCVCCEELKVLVDRNRLTLN